MLELENALAQIFANITPLPGEIIKVERSLDRVLSKPVIAPCDLPMFDNSAMDGFAVRSGDLRSASATYPVRLRLTETIPAGECSVSPINPGACARIFTGSSLPVGADAVVMQEEVSRQGPDGCEILFSKAVTPWENVRFHGEDVKRMDVVASVGDRVTLPRLTLFAALGITELTCACVPSVAVLATGSELRDPGEPLAAGTIYETNRMAIAALVERCNGKAEIFPIIPDDAKATEVALRRALVDFDVVISTGGVSVGEFDFVKQAFDRLGGQLAFWRVAIKPGKPLVFGRWQTKLFFGLPGNPVSAWVTFLLLVRPALLRMQGMTNLSPNRLSARLGEVFQNTSDRRHFVRVKVDSAGEARSAGIQASHILSSLAGADGLVEVPAQSTLQCGSMVSVIPLG